MKIRSAVEIRNHDDSVIANQGDHGILLAWNNAFNVGIARFGRVTCEVYPGDFYFFNAENQVKAVA